MAKTGRPTKYEPDRHPLLVRGYARDGKTLEEIAELMGLACSTVKEWANKHSEFSAALKAGRAETDFAVEESLYKRALKGDVTACIFWLKNRQPDKWREKKEHDINLGEGIGELLGTILNARNKNSG